MAYKKKIVQIQKLIREIENRSITPKEGLALMTILTKGKIINPICPQCHLENIIFDEDRLPKKCQFCKAALQNENSLKKGKYYGK